MNPRKLIFLTVALLLVCQMGFAQNYGPTTSAQVRAVAAMAKQTGKPVPLVPAAAPGHYRPFIWVTEQLTEGKTPGPLVSGLPSFCNKVRTDGGFQYCPNAMQGVLGVNNIVSANGGAGMTIGIVDAFHYANADADLASFNTVMGQPQCTIASGCFRQLDQNGNNAANTTCGSNPNWELETMLDLEYAHAVAPNAKLVLVEGCDNSFANLGVAVTTAVGLADVVSNSYGTVDFIGESSLDFLYTGPKPILFSSGDAGNPTSYPCSSPYVTCVGGTALHPVSGVNFTRASETGWAGSGGGCSIEEPAQNYQLNNGVNVCGAFRATPDIASDAQPNTGAIVYDSGNGTYFLVGGTSLATPLMAGIVADLDTARTTVLPTFLRKPKLQGAAGSPTLNSSLYLKYAGQPAGSPYSFYYFDILTGNNDVNGTGCCTAGPGYDLVTGLGDLLAPHAGPPWNLP